MSIWTVHGRLKNLRFTGSADQLKTLREHRHGESDLVCRDGKWFLIATCDVPEPNLVDPADWIGVDRGIANLATTSDGDDFSGRRLGPIGVGTLESAPSCRPDRPDPPLGG